jgi:hypothetical protein
LAHLVISGERIRLGEYVPQSFSDRTRKRDADTDTASGPGQKSTHVPLPHLSSRRRLATRALIGHQRLAKEAEEQAHADVR